MNKKTKLFGGIILSFILFALLTMSSLKMIDTVAMSQGIYVNFEESREKIKYLQKRAYFEEMLPLPVKYFKENDKMPTLEGVDYSYYRDILGPSETIDARMRKAQFTETIKWLLIVCIIIYIPFFLIRTSLEKSVIRRYDRKYRNKINIRNKIFLISLSGILLVLLNICTNIVKNQIDTNKVMQAIFVKLFYKAYESSLVFDVFSYSLIYGMILCTTVYILKEIITIHITIADKKIEEIKLKNKQIREIKAKERKLKEEKEALELILSQHSIKNLLLDTDFHIEEVEEDKSIKYNYYNDTISSEVYNKNLIKLDNEEQYAYTERLIKVIEDERNNLNINKLNYLHDCILNLDQIILNHKQNDVLSKYSQTLKNYKHVISVANNYLNDRYNYLINLNYKLKLGIDGEKDINKYLEIYEDEIINISNIRIEINGKSAESDNILLTTRGIFVIEVKNLGSTGSYSLEIEKDGRWLKKFKNGKTEVIEFDASEQNDRHIAILKRFINKNLNRTIRDDNYIEVHGIVVLANKSVTINNNSNQHVFRVSEVYRHINEYDKCLGFDDIETIKNMLETGNLGAKKYEILELESELIENTKVFNEVYSCIEGEKDTLVDLNEKLTTTFESYNLGMKDDNKTLDENVDRSYTSRNSVYYEDSNTYYDDDDDYRYGRTSSCRPVDVTNQMYELNRHDSSLRVTPYSADKEIEETFYDLNNDHDTCMNSDAERYSSSSSDDDWYNETSYDNDDFYDPCKDDSDFNSNYWDNNNDYNPWA